MIFLKSLICLEGHDNGRRFLAISSIFYLLLVLLLPIYLKAGILVLLLLLISSPILLTSSIRRIHDAGFITPLAAIPIVIFWINVFGLIYIDHSAKWLLLLLGSIATLIISTISNIRVRHNHNYQFGYHGPINEEEPITKESLNRVEPTIAASGMFENLKVDELDTVELENEIHEKQNKAPSSQSSQYSFKEQFLHWFNANKNVALAGFAATIILFIIILITPLIFNSTDNNSNIQSAEANLEHSFKKERNHKLEMPDTFWLMLDQNNALTIGWQGDTKEDGSYWSATTGTGDKTCTDLHFNLGDNIRTIEVTVKASEDYYADFSPVDTKLIIKSIADKDKFKLCGYEFELKGTRSLLRKHEFYREYLDIGLNN